MNHARCRSSAPPERPEHRVRPDLDVEAQRRVPVRVGVREGRVLDDLDARRRPRARANSVGPSGATATTTSTSATSPLVTNHFSPRIRQPPPGSGSAVVAIPDGSEPASRLGHRVGVLAPRRAGSAAASGRSAPRSRPTRRCRRSGCARRARSSSGRAAPRPAPTSCATSPGRRARRACRPPLRPAARPAARIAATSSAGSRPPAGSAACLAGDQLLVDEAARALRRPPRRRVRHQRGRHRLLLQRSRPGSPRASASWLATTSRTSARGLVVLRRMRGERRRVSRSHASQRVAPRAQHEPLGERPLLGDERVRAAAAVPAAQHRARRRQQPLRLRGEREPALVAPCH